MKRLSNAWRLAKASWAVLTQDRELVAVPIAAGLGALLAFLAVVLPGAALLDGDGSSSGGASNWAVGVLFVVAAVAAGWVLAIGQATVVAGAGQRMDGGDPTVGSAFAVARARLFRLLEWAFLATAVSLILDQIEERFGILGQVIAWLGNVAFSVLSFLALPVIVFEDVGAFSAFKRSSQLLKGTWGEQVSFSFGLGLLGLALIVPVVAVAALLVATGLVALQIVAVAAALAWIVLVAAVTSALSAVFKTALYRYANHLPVDPAFDQGQLAGAFRPKGGRKTDAGLPTAPTAVG